jgi:hypothetical protein
MILLNTFLSISWKVFQKGYFFLRPFNAAFGEANKKIAKDYFICCASRMGPILWLCRMYR